MTVEEILFRLKLHGSVSAREIHAQVIDAPRNI